jgi:hypothetical protein
MKKHQVVEDEEEDEEEVEVMSLRYERVFVTPCECCPKPSQYRIYKKVHTKLGIRVIHLCADHFSELGNREDVELLPLHVENIPEPQFRGYAGGLGHVIRDTDIGAMSQDEWEADQKGKRPRTEGSGRGGNHKLPPMTVQQLATAFAGMEI